ncbi:MAG: hypothetical protein JWO00_689 [Candidatus Parcubacteria bacterium]|nr:hypothetical protein [Candidatus Parcubacteria bacterium]
MKSIQAKDHTEGMHALASRISSALMQDQKVLWLICGGSNIPTAVEAMNEIRKSVPAEKISQLTVAQTDERYGPVDHPDSNWKQMQDDGFDFSGIRFIPILEGKPLEETITGYEQAIRPIFEKTLASGGIVIGQFGMGEDGHIAGILPHTKAVTDPRFISGYAGNPFTRITLTPSALMKISAAYAFVFGSSKAAAIKHLREEVLPLEDEPAQILKSMKEAYLYSDQ